MIVAHSAHHQLLHLNDSADFSPSRYIEESVDDGTVCIVL